MKKIISGIFMLVFVISCNHKNDNGKVYNITKSGGDTTFEKIDTINTVKQANKDSIKKTDKFYDSYPEIIKQFADKFVKTDLGTYQCSEIEKYLNNQDDLYVIDSIESQKIFGNNKSENYGSFVGSSLFSIEKPILNFYPITVIQGFGVAERPMMLVLFDKNGKYVNAIEVADAYGEEGGCLSSYFVNDSLLIREYEWDEYGEIPSKEFDGEYIEIIKKTKVSEQMIIHNNGTVTILEQQTKESPDLYNIATKKYDVFSELYIEYDTLIPLD